MSLNYIRHNSEDPARGFKWRLTCWCGFIRDQRPKQQSLITKSRILHWLWNAVRHQSIDLKESKEKFNSQTRPYSHLIHDGRIPCVIVVLIRTDSNPLSNQSFTSLWSYPVRRYCLWDAQYGMNWRQKKTTLGRIRPTSKPPPQTLVLVWRGLSQIWPNCDQDVTDCSEPPGHFSIIAYVNVKVEAKGPTYMMP